MDEQRSGRAAVLLCHCTVLETCLEQNAVLDELFSFFLVQAQQKYDMRPYAELILNAGQLLFTCLLSQVTCAFVYGTPDSFGINETVRTV